LLFITPVVYPSRLVPAGLQIFYGLNPMVGVVEGFRWALLGVGQGPSPMLGVSVLVALALFVSGIIWFRRKESYFADVLGA
jgi:lipopolysaccharide transport system permease protein